MRPPKKWQCRWCGSLVSSADGTCGSEECDALQDAWEDHYAPHPSLTAEERNEGTTL